MNVSSTRARDLGVVIGSLAPGPHNAITDVEGVRVGHCTLVAGEPGAGAVRTGVTVILPHDGDLGSSPVFAGAHRLNGNGEMTGLEWVRESGMLCSPVALTNTHSVGVVRDALIGAQVRLGRGVEDAWWLPVVAETWDGVLNDINGMHLTPEHVARALEAASEGSVAEGNVGGGTGMICHEFKGGIGTASRIVELEAERYTVGVLVQANHGRRERLQVNGVPVGAEIPAARIASPHTDGPSPGSGSIIAVVATDAPLLAVQCTRLAQRAGLGIARTGGAGEHYSGDLFLAFATGNRELPSTRRAQGPVTLPIRMLVDAHITALFDAVIEATEEAIVNALFCARTMAGRRATAHEIPRELVVEILDRHGARASPTSARAPVYGGEDGPHTG